MARLLVLWLLSERSSYGYEIKKTLGDEANRIWFALEDASIYSVLRTLTKNGYAEAVGTERAGARPTRTRYAITAAGRRYYRQLLVDALSTPARPIGPIDVALAARGDLPAADVGVALAQRAAALDEMASELRVGHRSAPSPAMAARNLAVIEAEQAWLAELDHTTIT